MTILICTGALYSEWQETLKKQLPAELFGHSLGIEISALGQEICGMQFPEVEELDWKPFNPDTKYTNVVNRVFSHNDDSSLHICGDNNTSLYLDTLKKSTDDTGFMLFYSSPEFELGKYISDHPFEPFSIEKVINAWFIRTRAMLTFYMNNRDRCLLVDVQLLNPFDDSFSRLLKNHFDIDIEPSPSDNHHRHGNSILLEYFATTLLLQNQVVEELFDEVRSAATLTRESDRSISSIQKRNCSLVGAFLDQVSAFKNLDQAYSNLMGEFSLNQRQLKQVVKKLERQHRKYAEQENKTASLVHYLNTDSLLKIARQARQIP